ncbi:MAG TPA: hypothetical protein VFZ33_05650 [Chitinophagaceae bacterium]
MTNDSTTITSYKSTVGNILGWFVGIIFLAVGLVNLFWGNDPGFGAFIILLSFVYLPPVNHLVNKWFGYSIPLLIKIALAIFIIWAAVGVGELGDKVDMMIRDFSA